MKKSNRQDGRPAFLFFPNDWLSSPDINSCSLEAQGLWIKMLCFMYQSPQKGVLLLPSGKQIESKTLAKLCGESEQLISKLLQELEDVGTFSRLEDSTIYCRRVKRESDLIEARREAGRLGGLKQKSSKDASKPLATLENENENENEYEDVNNKEKKEDCKGERKGWFNDIWGRYPNKDGKKMAEKHFLASVLTQQDWEDINTALDNYLKSEKVAKGYIKNGSTWFNNWRDWINFTGIANKQDSRLVHNLEAGRKFLERGEK